jgi:hypothetical protein
MPRGDGTGPLRGRGVGAGRGMGQRLEGQRGGGMGRMGRTGAGMGPAGECICPKCGARAPHQVGVSCNMQKCPTCGTLMMRK